MNLVDVLSVTKDVIGELMGNEYMETHGYLEAIPMEKIADVGTDVAGAYSSDLIYNTLVSRLTRYVIINNAGNYDVPSMYKTNDEWGGFIGFIETGLASIFVDPMFNLVDGTDYGEMEHKYYKPQIYTKYFKEAKSNVIALSRTENVKEAFKSASELQTFMSAIANIISETFDEVMNAFIHAIMCDAIAISDAGTETSVDLGTLAVTSGIITEDDLSDKDALLTNEAFLTFAMSKIAEIRDNFKDRTTAYNDGTRPVRCANNNLVLLNKFDNAVRFTVKPNTYNVESLNIGTYDKVNMWQSMKDSNGDNYELDTVSSVMLSADATQKLGVGTSAVTVNNCIGLLYDNYALGLTKQFEKTTSSYTAYGDFVNVFMHYLVNVVINKARNIVAFTLN